MPNKTIKWLHHRLQFSFSESQADQGIEVKEIDETAIIHQHTMDFVVANDNCHDQGVVVWIMDGFGIRFTEDDRLDPLGLGRLLVH